MSLTKCYYASFIFLFAFQFSPSVLFCLSVSLAVSFGSTVSLSQSVGPSVSVGMSVYVSSVNRIKKLKTFHSLCHPTAAVLRSTCLYLSRSLNIRPCTGSTHSSYDRWGTQVSGPGSARRCQIRFTRDRREREREALTQSLSTQGERPRVPSPSIHFRNIVRGSFSCDECLARANT